MIYEETRLWIAHASHRSRAQRGRASEREAEKNGLTSGKKLERRGVVHMRTAMSPWCGSEEWKERGWGRGDCNPLASLEQPGPDEPLETCFTHVCGHIMAFHDLYDHICASLVFFRRMKLSLPFFFLLQL